MQPERFAAETGAERVASRSNPRVAALSKLAEAKGRREAGLFLAEGIKLTREALASDAEVREVLVSDFAAERSPDALALALEARKRGIPALLLSDPAFEKISTEKSPQGVIAAVRIPDAEGGDFSAWQSGRRLFMLDEVRDPGNLGTILRSAEALGVGGVILSRCADPWQPKAVRAAMGTLFRLPLWITEDGAGCARVLRASGRRVLAAALGGDELTLGEFEPEESDCPVIGNEGHGLPREILDAASACLRIPMAEGPESLNASAAAACILWEYYRALGKS